VEALDNLVLGFRRSSGHRSSASAAASQSSTPNSPTHSTDSSSIPMAEPTIGDLAKLIGDLSKNMAAMQQQIVTLQQSQLPPSTSMGSRGSGFDDH